MKVTNIVNIDLSIRQNIPFVDAVQGDSARAIEFRLFDKGQPFNVPDGSAVLIRYKRPDGFGGVYDTLPNGEPAYSINANKVTAVLSPTALGVAGNVDFQVTVSNGEDLISAFALEIRVDADPSADVVDAEDYINISQFVTEESKKNAPYIGDNGNWWVNQEDTGVKAGGGSGGGGADGFSPVANVTQTDSGATITITDKNGTTTATVTNGKDGKDGAKGAKGDKGDTGATGAAGTTPVKGTDYFTEADKAEMVEDVKNSVQILKGKTIAVLGDSISSVAYTTPNYWQMIAEKTGCNFLDYGVSGSCIAVRTGYTTSFVERAANMESADAVLVMGGTNDVGKDILLGEWASTDNTTFYGALNDLISQLRTKYLGRPIVFCTPIKRMYDKDSGLPKTMADLSTAAASTNLDMWHCALAIQAKCAVHGIPVIDLYNASGIGSQMSKFFRTDDKLHPSILGECRIANMVQPVLEQQFLYTTEYDDTPEASYTNLVPTSIDANGSVYNTTGYMDGYRLSSSGGVSSSALSTATHTGFIPFVKGDTIRVIVPTALSGSGNYFNSYDASFTFLADEALNGFTNNAYGTTETLSDGRILITIFTSTLGGIDNAAYFRISANPATGAALIVTVNEEIT